MPDKDKFKDRLERYALFLKWLKLNNQRILQLAYKKFVKETGITV